MTGICRGCQKTFLLDELADEFCFDCSNGGPQKVSLRGAVKELLSNTVAKLAKVRGVTAHVMERRLVSEHYEDRVEALLAEPKPQGRGRVLN